MALLRATYLEHLRGIMRQMLLDDPTLLLALARGGVAYVRAGTSGAIRAERREALRILLTLAWQALCARPASCAL